MVLRARPGRVAKSLVYETFAFAFLGCIALLPLPAVMAQGRRKKSTHWLGRRGLSLPFFYVYDQLLVCYQLMYIHLHFRRLLQGHLGLAYYDCYFFVVQSFVFFFAFYFFIGWCKGYHLYYHNNLELEWTYIVLAEIRCAQPFSDGMQVTDLPLILYKSGDPPLLLPKS